MPEIRHERDVVPRSEPALPQLERLLDADGLAPRLRPLLGAQGALHLRVLKQTAGKRCVLAAEFEDGSRAILKAYRKRRAAEHARAQQALAAALQGPVRTPRPLDCWDDLGTVVQEWAPGVPVPEYAALDPAGDLLGRLGAALAALHEAAVPNLRPAGLIDHVRRTCHPGVAALAQALPQHAAALRRLETELYAGEARLPADARPCHGDFSPRQLFAAAGAVWLVDVDGLCSSQPAFDVAGFRVGLQAHLGPAGPSAAARFLDGYTAQRPAPAGLALFETFAWLRRAVIVWRKRPPNWDESFGACLARGRELLAT